MKLVIWMNMPSHHQSAFFQALRDQENIDLLVRYYGTVTSERLQMGWRQPESLPAGEMTVKPDLQALETVPDWRLRIHIIEGRDSFRRELTRLFCAAQVRWVHWGERGARRWTLVFRYPFWCGYGRQVAKYALGALAIGTLAAKDFLHWGIPASKIAFLPYAVAPLCADVEPDDLIGRFAAGRKIFLYCGELARHKGIDVLLRAFARLPDNNWVLVLVGPDRSGGKYLTLAKKLGVGRKILFRGTLLSGRIATAMIQANVFVLPSRYDGWGVVLNEAASLGKALIGTTACGAAHHLIKTNINGYRIPSNHPQALAVAMASYIHNPDLEAQHGQQSQLIFRDYSPGKNTLRLLDALRTWIESPAAL